MSPARPTNESESISEPSLSEMFLALISIEPDMDPEVNALVVSVEELLSIRSPDVEILMLPLVPFAANALIEKFGDADELINEFVIVKLADETFMSPEFPEINPDPMLEFVNIIGPELATVVGPAVAYSDPLNMPLKADIEICEAAMVNPPGVPGPS
jgi:hypothetical protein